MQALWLVVWSALCAVGSGLLVFFIMQSRLEVLLSRQREELAAARAELATRKETMQESLKQVEETTRRQTFDEFLSEIRVEERSYVREQKVLFTTRKSIIRQERIYFRNIPLSGWIDHEMPFEDSVDAERLAETMGVVTEKLLGDRKGKPVRKLLG
jgi:hypothetical protein